MGESELSRLADGLSGLVRAGLGQKSRWALKTALSAAETEGIGAVLVVRIPPKSKDHIDLDFQPGSVEVLYTWRPEQELGGQN